MQILEFLRIHSFKYHLEVFLNQPKFIGAVVVENISDELFKRFTQVYGVVFFQSDLSFFEVYFKLQVAVISEEVQNEPAIFNFHHVQHFNENSFESILIKAVGYTLLSFDFLHCFFD